MVAFQDIFLKSAQWSQTNCTQCVWVWVFYGLESTQCNIRVARFHSQISGINILTRLMMELVKNNSMYIVPLLLYTLLQYLLNYYLFSPMMCFDSFESHSYVPYNWIHSVICWYFFLFWKMNWDITQAQCKPIIILRVNWQQLTIRREF